MKALKKYLLAGLLVWLPLVITVWVMAWLIGLFDGLYLWVLEAVVNLLPPDAQHMARYPTRIHGWGVVLAFLVLLLTGALFSNVVGRWLLHRWDLFLARIPIVKSIYKSVKKVSDTLFSSNGNAFRQALLVQYPRQGVWTIAFQTGTPEAALKQHLPPDCISVYVPTTPNPTSGFFLIMPRVDVVPLDMTVDEALTYVISMGAASSEPKPLPISPEAKQP